MNGREYEPVVQIDTKKFTDTERDLILQVVARDEKIRQQEQNRLRDLKEEIRELRERAVPDDEEEAYGRVCKRCRTPLGLIFNSGALCPNCEKRVCKTCRIPLKQEEGPHGWLCVFCGKLRIIKAESGAWFYDQKSKPDKKKKVYGSLLIKRLFSTRQKRSDNNVFRDPDWSEILEAVDEEEEEEEERDQGYVLVSSNKHGEYSVKEGNLSDLLNSKAVLGLENARVVTRQEYEQLIINQQEQQQKEIKKDNNEDINEKQPKSLLALSKSNEYSVEEEEQKENENERSEQEAERDSENEEEYIEERDKKEDSGDDKLQEIKDEYENEYINEKQEDGNQDDLLAQSEVDGRSNGTVKNHVQQDGDDIDAFFDEYKESEGLSGSVESIGSNFSDEYIEQASNIAGEVMLGFKYDEREKTFEVQVHRAKDLIPADANTNTTDPYVKVYLDPDSPRKGGKRKTKAKKHSLNPEFDEVLTFSHLEYSDVVARSCLISIWHNDFYKNIRLGEVCVSMEEHVKSGFSLEEPYAQWYTLSGKVIQKEQVSFQGDIDFQLLYKPPTTQVADNKKQQAKLPNPTKGEFCVTIIRARGLRQTTGSNKETKQPNSFCKISFISNTVTSQFKTKYIKETTEPLWDEQFVIKDVAWQTLRESTMQISVWHYEKGNKHVLLGGARAGLGTTGGDLHDSFGDEIKVWQSFLDHPNENLDFSLSLRSTLESVKSGAIPPPDIVKTITEEEHEKMKSSKKSSLSSQSSLAKRFLNADTMSLASSGSMLSLYSNAGGEHDVIVTGEILFSMKHDDESGIFSVNIIKAKDIAAVNTKQQTSDPYVKVYLLPDKSKTSKKKTTHRRKTLNPQWDETIKYKISREDLMKRTLQLSIWNHDRFGRNDFLGEVQVNMKHYQHSNDIEREESVWYTLQEAAPVSIGDSDENKGEIVLGLKYADDKLTVLIKEAHNLTAADPDTLSNPFVKCYLLPDKSRRSKRKTSVKKKTIDPSWNERMEYTKISMVELQTRVLEITLWDHDSSSHQFLGGIRCGLPQGDEYWHDCFGKEVDVWEGMMKHVGIFSEYTVPLRSTMVSRKGQDIPMITELLPKIDRPADSPLPRGTPSLTVSLKYNELENMENPKGKKKDGDLRVIVKKGKNLEKEDGTIPSTFAKLTMYPKKKSLKMKTKVHPKSVEPIWDEEFVFENMPLSELRHKTLEIMIYEVVSNRRELGYVHLGLGTKEESWDDSIGREVGIWDEMFNFRDTWVTKEIPLRLCSDFYKELTKPNEREAEVEHDYDNEGKESPRTSALRAMGSHAVNVVENMQKSESEKNLMYTSASQDPLHVIDEESENERSAEYGGGYNKQFTVPSISISSEVEPGEAPFPGAGYEPTIETPDPVKKKDNPGITFLKRTTSQTSLTSVYSTDSANIYDQVPVRGDIQFGIKYDINVKIFEVHIYQARDLSAVDTKRGTSDPYCKVYLLPDKTKRGKRKTKTKKKTINPDWEQVLEYKITSHDLRTRSLWVSVWHQEKIGRNIFLGEVMINLDHIVDNLEEIKTPLPRWYTLCEKSSAPVADLYKGFLKIAIMFEDQNLYREQKGIEEDNLDDKKKKKKKKKEKKEFMKANGTIHLHIKEATDLPAADRDGLSDPFCKCYLLPSKHAKSKRKTPVIKHTKNPVWDYKTEYFLDYEELLDHGIELTVWDWDRGSSNDFLGCTRLSMGSHQQNWDDAEGVEIQAWKHLIDEPNKWKDFTIPLRSKMDYKKEQ